MSFGTLRDVDTRGNVASALAVGDETWAVGDILFAHPTVAGKLTNVRPQHDLAVAFITVRNATAGQIAIRIVPGNFHLEWLHDVNINSPSNGQLLSYDDDSDVWINKSAPEIINSIAYSAVTRLDVTSSGTSAYLFNNQYSGNNPTLSAIAGTTIAFNLNVPGHPFLIRYQGANYNTGLIHVSTTGVVTTGADAQGKTSGTLYWQLPSNISGDYGYLCSVHGSMIGTIKVSTIVQVPQSDNLIINGAMQVSQRGTSTTGITGTGYYTADRWLSGVGTMGTWTQTVENDGPTGSGFRKSFKILCTTADASPAAGDFVNVRQSLEGQNVQSIRKGTSDAQQLTMSFWVKANVTGTYIVELNDIDNSRVVAASYSILSSGTWEKKTLVFPADTTGVLDNDNAVSLRPQFWLGAGSDFTSGTLATSWQSSTNANRAVGQVNLAAATNNYWQITGVQLEVGPVANPFNFKDFGTELAACRRYYKRNTAGTIFGLVLGTGSSANTTVAIATFNDGLMRVAPTSVEYANICLDDGNTVSAITNVTNPSNSTSEIQTVTITSSGLTGFRPYRVAGNNNAAGFIAVSAEL